MLLKLCLLALAVKNNGRWTDLTLFCSTRQLGSFAFSAKRTPDNWALSCRNITIPRKSFTHQHLERFFRCADFHRRRYNRHPLQGRALVIRITLLVMFIVRTHNIHLRKHICERMNIILK